MELYFNEQSIKNKSSVGYDSAAQIAKTYKELLNHGITTCRIASEDSARLFRMICEMPESVNVKHFYFSFFRSPYESEAVEDRQEAYLSHSWHCGEESCVGLAFAYLLDAAGFSIRESGWNVPSVAILKDGQEVTVRNICTQEHVKLYAPHLKEAGETGLSKTSLTVSEKEISLRDDHGADVLERFSKRLVQSEYVTGVINSLPYNAKQRRFIRKIREDGLIEIVLPWTDEGLGIVVKTTGRTLRETETIAEILEEEYGYT
ncbi:MAG: hypothetical protein HFI35_03465 [Roseburia sp.]|nr:hypothetical protein [Roseburia sp.]